MEIAIPISIAMEIANPISLATLSSDINGAGTRGPATKFRSRWRRLAFAPPVTGQEKWEKQILSMAAHGRPRTQTRDCRDTI